ncbi:MAG TPA: chemotaxis protein CheW [Rudaea sp.]|jgi:twitching motility protein PilI
MSTALDMFTLSPFDALAEFERRSLAHVAGVPEQIEAPGLWRGIGFRVGSRYLVSSINEVNEILTYPSLTLVPGTRTWLLGVANVRGNLVPLIDLKQYLEGERTLVSEVSRVLLVRQSGGSVGLLIDEVLGQRNFSQEQRADAIGEEDDRYNRFVPEKYLLGEVYWGLFSMAALVRTPDFAQASA